MSISGRRREILAEFHDTRWIAEHFFSSDEITELDKMVDDGLARREDGDFHITEVGRRLANEAGLTEDAEMVPDSEIEKQWPGFYVECKKCGSDRVLLENDMGFSALSGGWGGVSFNCQSCKNKAVILEN